MTNLNNNTCREMARLEYAIERKIQEEERQKQQQELALKEEMRRREYREVLDEAIKECKRSSILAFVLRSRQAVEEELLQAACESGLEAVDFFYSVVRFYRKERSFLSRLLG